MHTKLIGDIAEAKIIARALEMGYKVSIPFGENQLYDLLLDDSEKIIKVQVKSRKIVDGIINVPLKTSSNSHSYKKEIDEIWVYCPSNDTIYRLILRNIHSERAAFLRIEEPKLKQKKY